MMCLLSQAALLLRMESLDQGVAITETELPSTCMVTESVAGQVVGQYVEKAPVERSVDFSSGSKSGFDHSWGSAP
ncbi:hypothetical protein MLD38_027328 [Melastoma candidum]|uniref:Uncharacterized protein n=1 Tax=Melastoma candidum TaxID=119954 RepID=A0ACB9P319_9MYRT|nr:hypothetical protein MLD38_027328 [Melastoma candidum]